MTEREGVPSDRLVVGETGHWPTDGEWDNPGEREPDAEWQPDADWQWGDRWPPQGASQSSDEWPPSGDWEWTELPYDDPAWFGVATRAPGPRPWYRRPGFLTGVIITALVALVVASVLLLTRATFSEQDETRLKPTIRTSSVILPSRTQASPTTTSPTTSATEPTPSDAPPEQPEPTPQPQPAPAGPTAGGAIGEQDPATPVRPRINVTRTPMSFTPGGR